MKRNNLPNFLIVGAAKSGTTFLYECLKEHPEIFMPSLKEPRFITSNFINFPLNGMDENVEKYIVKDFNNYLDLFSCVGNKNCIGEASTDNLYFYKDAIKYIKKNFGDIKIIIILRNPIERAFSAYLHLVRDNREFLTFEEALLEEDKRKNNNWDFIWFYKDAGLYYKQVKAYLENFLKVKIYLYENLKNNPLFVLKDIYSFLEVDNNYIPKSINKKFNISGVPKINFMHQFILKPNIIKTVIRYPVRIVLPRKYRLRIINKILYYNLKKPEINEITRESLKLFFKEDILKLQVLSGIDLSNWIL
jgi:hypothetical protein